MPENPIVADQLGQFSARVGGGIYKMLAATLLFVLAVFFIEDPFHDSLLFGASIGLLSLFVVLKAAAFHFRRVAERLQDHSSEIIDQDPLATIVADLSGEIVLVNPAAFDLLGARPGSSVLRALLGVFDNPAPLIFRLQTKARLKGAAQEDVISRRGRAVISVHRFGNSDQLVWRLSASAARIATAENPKTDLPSLIVGKSGDVLFVNEALKEEVSERPSKLSDLLGEGEIAAGDRRLLMTRSGPLSVQIVSLEQADGRRDIILFPISELPDALDGWARLDELNIAFVKLTPDGKVLIMNRHAAKLLGCDPGCDELPIDDLVEGLGRPVKDWLAEAARSPGLRRPEIVCAVRGAKDTYLQITLARIDEGDGFCIAAVLSDATELKTLEAQFVQSQKMQAIGQLAGGIAHDFNNLLTAISGHCDLLLLRHDQGDLDYDDLQQIHQNANRAAALVGQLLAFSRKQNLQPELIDLRDTMADLTHLLNRLVGEKIDLSLSHDPDLRPTRADKRQLEQVIMNLVVNARDAMQEHGGSILISTQNATFAADHARDRAVIPAGNYVLVKVEDSGCGIPKARQQKIFEPFYTTKRPGEGTGLGLSTAYGIIKQTGGFIFADSELGRGTVFSVYLPAAEIPEGRSLQPKPDPARARRTLGGDGVVLLVEDEAPVRAFASRALNLRGYTVIEASDAEEALEKLSDGTLHVDLFVTDVVMPGMDGPTWVRKARKARPNVPVVFVSGYAEESFSKDQAEIENCVFLPKPFSLAELTETVQRQME